MGSLGWYPQSNGKAENAVKQAKKLMKKTLQSKSDPFLVLLEIRDIPSETSPSQRLFSRRTNTKIPITKTLLQMHVCEDVQEKLIKRKVNQARYYNKGTAELKTLKPGQDVRVKMDQKWVKAKVEHQVDIRSYKLRTENGQEYRRNRRHIRKTETSSNEPANVQQRSTTQNTNSFGCLMQDKTNGSTEKWGERKQHSA